MSKTSQALFCFFCVLGGLLAVFLAWTPVSLSISHFIIEDMFYYLQAARHLDAGEVASLDGIHATNGFHPLWMIVAWVVGIFPGIDGNLPIHLALTLCALAFILTGVVLFLCLRKTTAAPLALPLTALFLCNYRMMTIPLGGLESGIAGLSVGLLTLFLLTHQPGWKSSIQLGLLLGLACLCRLDALLLTGIVLVWWCLAPFLKEWRVHSPLHQRAGGEHEREAMEESGDGKPASRPISPVSWISPFLSSALAGVVCLALLMPWFVFSWETSHTLLPNSRVALESWRGYQWNPDLGYAGNLKSLVKGRMGQSIEPLNDFGVILGVWPVASPLTGKLRYWGAIMTLCAFLALLALVWKGYRSAGILSMAWIPVYVVAHMAYYVFFGHIEIRYFYPTFLPALVGVGACAGALLSSSRDPARSGRWVVFVAVLLLLGTTLGGVDSFRKGYATRRFHPLHLGLQTGMASYLKVHTPSEARIGSFNAGILSYYSRRKVVNLDGVMNDSVIPAIQNKRLAAYIDQEGIDYLADVKEEIDKFMDRFGGDPEWRVKWDTVFFGPGYFCGTKNMDLVVMKRK